LVAAANRRDEGHALAASLVTDLGRDLLIPDPVIVEVDQLLRSRMGGHSARLFLGALAAGEHTVVQLSPAVLRRAVAIDAAFADLELGYADSAVMAIAEREALPILTFDFTHFPATRPAHGYWNLVIDEHRYHQHTQR
jgi:predicted nucleic acid-binding protein